MDTIENVSILATSALSIEGIMTKGKKRGGGDWGTRSTVFAPATV